MISFSCRRCGRPFELQDSLAGKMARCKGCGSELVIPRAGQPTGLDPADGYQPVDERVEHARRAPARSQSDTPAVPFEPGDTIRLLTVDECTFDYFAISYTLGRLLLFVLSGVPALLTGFWLFYQMELTLRGQVRLPVFLFLIPVLFVGYGVWALFHIARVGYRMTFDRTSASLMVTRWYLWSTTWPAEDLGGLVFVVQKSKSLGDGEPERVNRCETFVVDRRGRLLASLAVGRIKKSNAALSLAKATVHAGRVLALPIVIELSGEPGHEDVHRAVELIRGSGLHQNRDPSVAFPRPFFSIERMTAIVAIILSLGGILYVIF